jgi:hypothetical protein
MANLGIVINPMFGYLFGYGFRVVSNCSYMGPDDRINYEEGIGVDVEERGCGLLQNIGRFLSHSMTLCLIR